MIDRKELAALASERLPAGSPSFGFLMITYPTAGDYYRAVQVPARSFTTPRLQAAEFVWDSLGPTLARGRSAVVFQAAIDGSRQALRCYIRNASSRNRYNALGAYLDSHELSPVLSRTTWLDSAIRVKGETWPVLQMDWIDGRTLNEYVDFLVADRNTGALATLAVHWRDMVALLQDSEFAHGDLQHGNVLVDQEGRLRLVDFDGVWIPQLAGQSPPNTATQTTNTRSGTNGIAGSTLSPRWSFTCLWSHSARIPRSGCRSTIPRTCCSPRLTSSPRSRPRPGNSWRHCTTRRLMSWCSDCRNAARPTGCQTGAWR